MTADQTKVRRWRRREGDRFYLVFPQIEGSRETGFETRYYGAGDPNGYHFILNAKAVGLRDRGSDDFQIAAVRDGKLAALLWMTEIVDDGFDVLAEAATQLGLPQPQEAPRA